MKVTINYFPGPDPESVTFNNVEKITTVEQLGYLRLVVHRSIIHGGPSAYSTPLYLIKGIEVEPEIFREWKGGEKHVETKTENEQ